MSLFSQRLAAHAPLAAAATRAVVDDTSLSSMALAAVGSPPDAYALHVAVSERQTYRVPLPVQPGELPLTGPQCSCQLQANYCNCTCKLSFPVVPIKVLNADSFASLLHKAVQLTEPA